MGNVVGSFFTGFGKAVGNIFGAPLDFLAGKNCSSICSSTWDLICYIENFCIANLLKLLVVLVLLYIVLLFVYLLFKIGICGCVGRGMCKMTWGCLSSCFRATEYVCATMWYGLKRRRRTRRRAEEEEAPIDLEDYGPSSSDDDDIIHARSSYAYVPRRVESRRRLSVRSRNHRRNLHIQRSLRPRSHRLRVGVGGGSVYVSHRRPRRHVKTIHDIRVTKTSRFVHKGHPSARFRRRRRW